MRPALILLATASLFAANTFAAGTVKLHGKITNPISDSISVRFYESWVGYEPQTIGAKLAADGSYSLSFPLRYKYTNVTITHGGQETEFTPAPGDDLTLNIDAKNFDSSLHYEGKGADVANFNVKHMLFSGGVLQFSRQTQIAASAEPDKEEDILKADLQKELDFLEANGKSLPADFKKSWKAIFQYGVYYSMMMYPTFHEMQKQHSYSIKNIPKEDYVTVAQVPAAFDDDLLNITAYRLYIGMYYREKDKAKNAGDTTSKESMNDFSDVEKAYKNMPKKSAEVFAANDLWMKVKYLQRPEFEKRVNVFKERYPHSEYLPLLEEKLALKKKVGVGSMAMDFSFTTIDGKSMKLSDFKGKVVYLDFWASWCGPCIGEMPSAKKLEANYKDKNIVFLYVSIDADEASWKKAMDKLQIEGVHTRDGGGWEGNIAKLYGVNGIPAYFLIDKEGKFALDVTPRPSSNTTLTDAIDKLLQ